MRVQEINVYTVIFHKGKVLALQRKSGLWEFAGGGVEWGEMPEQAAIRETKEETGLGVKNLQFLTLTSATYAKEGKEKHAIYIIYKAESDSAAVVLSKEHISHRWLSPSELRFLQWGLNAESVPDLL